MQEHHLTVPCTARFFTLGHPSASVKQVWFLCHGYGQLAATLLEEFRVLDNGDRYLVAPEGLSRYYTNHRAKAVGASWMTREDRLSEIADYVRYLDHLYEHVFATVRRSDVGVYVLGFSQGAATAARWISLGQAVADRLILWGELLPPDLDLEAAWGKLEDARLTFVVGSQDRYLDPDGLLTMEERLFDHEIPYETIAYDGGHWIDRDILNSLATR